MLVLPCNQQALATVASCKLATNCALLNPALPPVLPTCIPAAAVAEIVVGVLVLGSAAPSCCRGLLTWSHPGAGWRTAAALMDRASFNIYKSSLIQADKAHAVCCTTLNTTLVCGWLEPLCVEYQYRTRGHGAMQCAELLSGPDQ